MLKLTADLHNFILKTQPLLTLIGHMQNRGFYDEGPIIKRKVSEHALELQSFVLI
jgi:hypothetical protein